MREILLKILQVMLVIVVFFHSSVDSFFLLRTYSVNEKLQKLRKLETADLVTSIEEILNGKPHFYAVLQTLY